MAELTNAISVSLTTDVYEDYGGGPSTYTPARVEATMLIPPVVRDRKVSEVMVNSATGEIPYAYLDHGLAPGNTYEVTYVFTDPKNSGAVDTTLLTFLMGMWEGNLVAGYAAFAAWVVTNQLTGGGKSMVKHKCTLRDSGGNSHVLTLHVSPAAKPEVANQDGHYSIKATWLVLAAITRA